MAAVVGIHLVQLSMPWDKHCIAISMVGFL